MENQNLEFLAVIKFPTKEGPNAREIHRCMADVYGDNSPQRQSGQQNLNVDEALWRMTQSRSGQPVDAISKEIVEGLVMKYRRIKVDELARECGISYGSVCIIIHEHLGMSKISARWVPRNLNMQDRQQSLESCRELLEIYNANPEDFHTRLVTGDETWIHHWDPDTKKESMQWKCPGSTPTKKFRTRPSAGKVMATVFWDLKGVILINVKPAGSAIIGSYYADLINQLRAAIKENRRGKLAAGVLLLHDGAQVKTCTSGYS
ncbi:uncharacterized protein LOC128548188 [Mercenaria mercenaria]|uniref:uncharacterized protein LOC128548188 n=1 Tax=Mercenaria mercenaria TaxID=6596 RepID=UPI00234E8859|nr:uncharacterized protein LOC128548188 [Mercenaria mercenaria]